MAGYCVSFVLVAESPVSIEKCIAAISHLPSFFSTVSERLRGKANSFPSFYPFTFPAVINQPISDVNPPILNWYSNFCSPLSKPSKKCS